MLILSVGMPRAGSGWHYNLIHDLVVTNGGTDARQIRSRFHLERFLTEVNCNIGTLSSRRLLPVLAPSLLGNTFAIKAHAGPTPTAVSLMRSNLMRTTYIYRDPRDAMLSAYEYGKRSRESGHDNAFARLTDFEAALNFMQEYIVIWEKWMSVPEALHCRYEDLLEDYDAQIPPLLEKLSIDTTRPEIAELVEKYRPEQSRHSEQRGLHFRKGKIGRFRTAFSHEEQQACIRVFGPALARMGYAL